MKTFFHYGNMEAFFPTVIGHHSETFSTNNHKFCGRFEWIDLIFETFTRKKSFYLYMHPPWFGMALFVLDQGITTNNSLTQSSQSRLHAWIFCVFLQQNRNNMESWFGDYEWTGVNATFKVWQVYIIVRHFCWWYFFVNVVLVVLS